MLIKIVMTLPRSFQSREQQVVQPSLADPGVGRSKVVFEVWPQDATDSLNPIPLDPAFFPGDGKIKMPVFFFFFFNAVSCLTGYGRKRT